MAAAIGDRLPRHISDRALLRQLRLRSKTIGRRYHPSRLRTERVRRRCRHCHHAYLVPITGWPTMYGPVGTVHFLGHHLTRLARSSTLSGVERVAAPPFISCHRDSPLHPGSGIMCA